MLVKQSLTQPQLYLTLFSLFALLALLLAGIGLYGLIAYSVAQRTREFGIRFALGAQVGDVLRLVLGQGARLTAIGLVSGLLAAAAVARLMQTLLFRTTAYDPMLFWRSDFCSRAHRAACGVDARAPRHQGRSRRSPARRMKIPS